MSEVTIRINGKGYQIACEDGQEEHLLRLAEFLDQRVQDVISTVGQVGPERLASLLIADELSDSFADIEEARANPDPDTVKQLQAEATEKAEAKAAHIFEMLADRIETIAERIEQA